jgi:hypothetical protein
MKSILQSCFPLVALALLSACSIATRAYVEPAHHQATADAIRPLAQPIPVKVIARFQVNGKPAPAADAGLQRQLEQALANSGVFAPGADDAGAPRIEVTANDSSDLASARHRGYHTGLTLGSSGSLIDDDYDFTVAYRDMHGADYQAVYRHATHTAIGNHVSGPAGVAPTTPEDAFHQVVNDVVMNFVWDLQSRNLPVH